MYDANSKRIDDFVGSYVHENSKYRKCWKIIMLVYVLPHGQSVAERGFSINKEVKVENLSLISQQLVYEFTVLNDSVKSCRLAHSRYVKVMEDFKKANLNDKRIENENSK